MAISPKPTSDQETSGMSVIHSNAQLGPSPHFDYRGDVIASDAKRLRFWSRLGRVPTPLRAHSQEPVGRPDSA
jgi:hypothetical protein